MTKVGKLCVVQMKSQARCDKGQVLNLKALGLGKVGKCVTLDDNACVRGMLRKVSHLVKVDGSNE